MSEKHNIEADLIMQTEVLDEAHAGIHRTSRCATINGLKHPHVMIRSQCRTALPSLLSGKKAQNMSVNMGGSWELRSRLPRIPEVTHSTPYQQTGSTR